MVNAINFFTVSHCLVISLMYLIALAPKSYEYSFFIDGSNFNTVSSFLLMGSNPMLNTLNAFNNSIYSHYT